MLVSHTELSKGVSTYERLDLSGCQTRKLELVVITFTYFECRMSGIIELHILKVHKDLTKSQNNKNFMEVFKYKDMPTCITTL